MTRHFLQLYLMIVATLAVVSWGQDRLWQSYSGHAPVDAAREYPAQTALLALVTRQVNELPPAQRSSFIAQVTRQAGIDLELFDLADIAGAQTLATLRRGEPAVMHDADNLSWLLQPTGDDQSVLAYRFVNQEQQRTVLDWLLSLAFYAAIALVIMMWLWPLRRDLRRLEHSTTRFGDRNWRFDTRIDPRSPIYPLARSFQRMTARIDGLIRSQQDMTNAMSHEIKTPLARMRFEVEMAHTATEPRRTDHLHNITKDIAELNTFVTATLDYAILERAEVVLNVATHDLTQMLPAIVNAVQRSSHTPIVIDCSVDPEATQVNCDAHLWETVLKNLLYNALRYAQERVQVSVTVKQSGYRLCVDDDGPGIAEADRQRVLESFVQLTHTGKNKTGFGLGLAIVRQIVQWHEGSVAVYDSPLGGARFCIEWPAGSLPARA